MVLKVMHGSPKPFDVVDGGNILLSGYKASAGIQRGNIRIALTSLVTIFLHSNQCNLCTISVAQPIKSSTRSRREIRLSRLSGHQIKH
jgi:hypothetical protein